MKLVRRSVDLALGLLLPDAAFLMLRGSYLVNWAYPFRESFIKSCVASPSTGLAVLWAGRTHNDAWNTKATGPWRSGRMFLGGTLGDLLLDTFNGPVPQSTRSAYILGTQPYAST